MSLKGFHLFFISIAAIFCAIFGVWALFFNSGDGGMFVKILGGITLLAAPALVAYAIYFFRKTKKLLA